MLSLDLLEEANTPLYKPCHSVPRYCFFFSAFSNDLFTVTIL